MKKTNEFQKQVLIQALLDVFQSFENYQANIGAYGDFSFSFNTKDGSDLVNLALKFIFRESEYSKQVISMTITVLESDSSVLEFIFKQNPEFEKYPSYPCIKENIDNAVRLCKQFIEHLKTDKYFR